MPAQEGLGFQDQEGVRPGGTKGSGGSFKDRSSGVNSVRGLSGRASSTQGLGVMVDVLDFNMSVARSVAEYDAMTLPRMTTEKIAKTWLYGLLSRDQPAADVRHVDVSLNR